jgi:RHS repeat-associated protein
VQGGQLEQQTDPDPGNGQPLIKQFIYDAEGRRAGVRTGTTSDIASAPWQCTSYDSRGRLSSQSWPAANGAPARTVTYSYAVGGNPLVSSVSDPSGTITSTVDLLGRVTSYTDAWGQTTATTYNQAGQTTATSGPGGSSQLGYDPNSGQPTTTTVNGTLLATASYDRDGRMNAVTYHNGTSAVISYDAYGKQNGLTYDPPGGGTLDQDTVTRSLAGRESTETASAPGGPLTVAYTYDAVDRLIQSTSTASGSTPIRYAYAGYSDSPAAVLSTSGSILQQLVGLPGGVSVTLQPSGNVWSYFNMQGDTTLTASDTGTLLSGPVTYDPWGTLNPGQTAPGNTTGPNTRGAYAAAGKLTNTATGTVLLGARTFNPTEARFLSVDAVFGGCANPYTYAFGDPINHPDLTGQDACAILSANAAIDIGNALKEGDNAALQFILKALSLPFQFLAQLLADLGTIGQSLINAGKAARSLASRSGNPAASGNGVVVVSFGVKTFLGIPIGVTVFSWPAIGIPGPFNGPVQPQNLSGPYIDTIRNICSYWI